MSNNHLSTNSNKRSYPNHHSDSELHHKKQKKDVNLLLLLLCSSMIMLGNTLIFCSIYSAMEETVARSEAAFCRCKNNDRKDWSHYNERISNRMFYRMYRMHRPCFEHLCAKIEKSVGKQEFKSESHIQYLRNIGHATPYSSMYHASRGHSGEWIQGELKVAITLRYLAGASYLDLFMAYHVSADHILKIVCDVKRNWFCHKDVCGLDFYRDVLDNPDRLRKIAYEFGEGSGGVLNGCIGAIDGWLVRIICPTRKEAKNPGKYMSRKGFFALNVQVICDKKRRVLWSYIGAKGSSHDSTVLKTSGLYQHLMSLADTLYEKGLYLVGDSAYALRGFMICPYDNAKHGSTEDNFNFYQSSQRIHIECTFGEIYRRFGVFWRPLGGGLKEHRYTIEACLRLHNFIVDYREELKLKGSEVNDDLDSDELEYSLQTFQLEQPFENMGVVLGDNMRPSGRPAADEVFERDRGVALRDIMAHRIKMAGIARPT